VGSVDEPGVGNDGEYIRLRGVGGGDENTD
jgi:hypothetical protein